MAKARSKVPNSTISKYPRAKASLDSYWMGPSQHIADGVSSDPATRWSQTEKAGAKRQQGEEAGGPPEVEIE